MKHIPIKFQSTLLYVGFYKDCSDQNDNSVSIPRFTMDVIVTFFEKKKLLVRFCELTLRNKKLKNVNLKKSNRAPATLRKMNATGFIHSRIYVKN
jgi:hypothetical protein